MKRMTFIAGDVALFPKAHGKSSDQCELTPKQTQQICAVNRLPEKSASNEPVFTSTKRWPAIESWWRKSTVRQNKIVRGRFRRGAAISISL